MNTQLENFDLQHTRDKRRFKEYLDMFLNIPAFNRSVLENFKISILPYITEGKCGAGFGYNITIEQATIEKPKHLNISIRASAFVEIILENNLESYFTGNNSIIKEDIAIFKERWRDNEKEYADYLKFKMKCELLGIPCNKIVAYKDINEYVLEELVPDEKGIAVIPDFVTKVYPLKDKYKYRLIVTGKDSLDWDSEWDIKPGTELL